MEFPDEETVARRKRDWTDRYVTVVPGKRPELTRFEGKVGRIVTINAAGRAIVDFADCAWYDLPSFEDVLTVVTDETQIKKYDASANSAQKLPGRQG